MILICTSLENNDIQPILESEKHRLVYQPPVLTIFDAYKTETGNTNVPESNNGLIS